MYDIKKIWSLLKKILESVMFEHFFKSLKPSKIIETKQNQDQNGIKQCLEMSKNISVYAVRF